MQSLRVLILGDEFDDSGRGKRLADLGERASHRGPQIFPVPDGHGLGTRNYFRAREVVSRASKFVIRVSSTVTVTVEDTEWVRP